MTQIKEWDGGREVQVEAHSGSLFLEGCGFSYEFDQGVFLNGIASAVADGADLQAAIMYPPRRAYEGPARWDAPDRSLVMFDLN